MGALMNRRDLLRLGLGTAAAFAASPAMAFARARKIPLSVQLYSVRDVKDYDSALQQIAAMGFNGVEFAGYNKYGKDAQGLRKKLDELGLKAAATHIGANQMTGDALKGTIEFHKTIGCTLLICPGDGRFTKPEPSKEFAELMNKAAEALKPEGLRCGYHNHAGEFAKAEDSTWWDLFATRTSKDVVLQQDAGWTVAAGKDPVEYVKKYPGRTKTTHIKSHVPKGAEGKKPFIGQDTTDWSSYVKACAEVGGTEWFSIEQEVYPDGKSSMECVKISLEGFKKILADAGL
jgi:sugar phosphate isomerase/epimerase